jgi:hypothetical protein
MPTTINTSPPTSIGTKLLPARGSSSFLSSFRLDILVSIQLASVPWRKTKSFAAREQHAMLARDAKFETFCNPPGALD